MLAQSFVVGLFAMIPVFSYKYLYEHFLPRLAEFRIFQPLFQYSLVEGLMIFLFNLVLLSLILLIASALVSLAISAYPHQTLVNVKNALKQEPLGFVAVSLMIGFLMYIQFGVEHLTQVKVVGTVLGSVLFLAVIEEYIKHLMVRISDDNRLNDVDDAITLSIVVGLAFAFVETLIYAFNVGNMGLVIFRSLISLPIHVVASGIFGYYYGLSKFSAAFERHESFKKRHLRKWLHRLLNLKKHTLYGEEKIVEGTLLASLYHGLMNLLLEFNLSYLTIPFLVMGVFVIFGFYKKGQLHSHRFLAYWRRRSGAPVVQ
ncbi:PrsW family intramembrane metalloprotease [Candidatus Peregrinibacteria bacterium]|nr:MAG: PrsW family intramembrane metalloprotease [Candidatus Peregrinibacteria bacterium]